MWVVTLAPLIAAPVLALTGPRVDKATEIVSRLSEKNFLSKRNYLLTERTLKTESEKYYLDKLRQSSS